MKTVILCFFFLVNIAQAKNTIVNIGYVFHGPPFHIEEKGKLIGGVVYDISKSIAKKAGLVPAFSELPTKRTDEMLVKGRIQMLCFHNPKWSYHPDKLLWGPEVIKRKEFFIISNNTSDLKSYDDLKNMLIGTHLGYHYSQLLTKLFDAGIASRVNKQKTSSLYKLLKMQRVHTIIDNEYSFYYQVQAGNAKGLKLSSLIDKEYSLHCVFSKNNITLTNLLLKATQIMIEDGSFIRLLKKYTQKE
ncbi:substrate-binding periplasmic protein [Zooshikella harenae]|uniref:Transporter substrate-binding domain-containing protein n=1 Tax=Zooshikella harenae TaxID=2827238 RepID=A0ABS5ZA52_9GAMM|nr:transporter substrate-binding domain-containing protein [Zooshikella harenae]MBU2710934.1 transporter substrate-binding domain-containing protein [Zooshikella harenae]